MTTLGKGGETMRWRQYVPMTLFAVALVLAWEASVRVFDVPKYLLPSPLKVAEALYTSLDVLIGVHTPVTLLVAGLGLVMATVAGVVVGGMIHFFPLVRRMCYPFVIISQTVPVIVLAPLLVIWFGYGIFPKLLVVTIACFFPMAVAMVDGLDGADVGKSKLLRSMSATRWQEFTLVKLPTALPSLFTGLRVAATYAVMAAVISEWMGADAGLGVYIVRSAHSFRTEHLFAGIVLITVYSIIAFLLVGWARQIVLPWERYVSERHKERI